jgi:hypothetical protein
MEDQPRKRADHLRWLIQTGGPAALAALDNAAPAPAGADST